MSQSIRRIDFRARIDQALATFAGSAAWLRRSVGGAAGPPAVAATELPCGEYETRARVEEDLT